MLNLRMRNWNRTALLAAAVAIGAAGAIATGPAGHRVATAALPVTEATATEQSVSLYSGTWAFDVSKSNGRLVVKSGVAYLPFKELSDMFGEFVWTYDGKSGLIVTGPNKKLVWKPGSRQAAQNGILHKMSGAPFVQKGELYVPLKDIAVWAGGEIKPAKGQLVIAYAPLSFRAGDAKGWYWVRKDNGIVYTAVGTDLPHSIGKSNVRAFQYGDLQITRLSDGKSVLLRVNHSHGEPSLNDEQYTLLIQNGRLARQTKVSYSGVHSIVSIKEADGDQVALDGSKLLFLAGDGSLDRQFDLAKLGGLDEPYTVEYASLKDGLLLIRPYVTATLMLVDIQSGKTVTLYKELLSEEEQRILDSWSKSPSSMELTSDELTLVKRDGDTFTFEHRSFTGTGTEKQTLTYSLKR